MGTKMRTRKPLLFSIFHFPCPFPAFPFTLCAYRQFYMIPARKPAHSMLAFAWAVLASSKKICCEKHSELTLSSAVHVAGAARFCWCSRAIILSVCKSFPFCISAFLVRVRFLLFHTPVTVALKVARIPVQHYERPHFHCEGPHVHYEHADLRCEGPHFR